MDLSTLEAAATTSRHAVAFFASGAGIAGLLAYRSAIKKNESKRLDYQLAAVLLAICGACATGFNFYYTDEISKERDRGTKAKDDELARFRLEKTAEIEQLEKGNLILREQVGLLEKSNLKATKEVASLQFEVAIAKRRQAEAETQLATVARNQRPRNLRIQNELLISRLKAAPGKMMVQYLKTDPESILFGSSLNSDLQSAGWKNMGGGGVSSTTELGASNGDVDF